MARMPGWDKECRMSKTVRLNDCGTYGRGVPVLISQSKVASDVGNGTGRSWSEDELSRSGSSCCVRAMLEKSSCDVESGTVLSASTSRRDSASAAALDAPLMNRMSKVNCEIKSRWRIWHGEWCLDGEASGLWSVITENCHPSRKC